MHDFLENASLEISYKTYKLATKNRDYKVWNKKMFFELLGQNGIISISSPFPKSAIILARKYFESADIILLEVGEEVRRQGLGEVLLRRLCLKLFSLGTKKVILEVAISNFAAYALYKKVGFKKIGHRKNYYNNFRDNEDAIVMDLDLT